jgi:uncharacterized damage-inducible protein DinB
MSVAKSYLPEFEQEMATTRRVLERVPDDKGEWKPHPKSFSMGHLAQLVARIPGWITSAVSSDRLDLATYPGYSTETTATLLAEFDRHVAEARTALGTSSDTDMMQNWSLVRGDMVLFSAPKRAIIRNHTSHLIHHRGQLTVYLRLVDVPVPMVYGPTADERMG